MWETSKSEEEFAARVCRWLASTPSLYCTGSS